MRAKGGYLYEKNRVIVATGLVWVAGLMAQDIPCLRLSPALVVAQLPFSFHTSSNNKDVKIG